MDNLVVVLLKSSKYFSKAFDFQVSLKLSFFSVDVGVQCLTFKTSYIELSLYQITSIVLIIMNNLMAVSLKSSNY